MKKRTLLPLVTLFSACASILFCMTTSPTKANAEGTQTKVTNFVVSNFEMPNYGMEMFTNEDFTVKEGQKEWLTFYIYKKTADGSFSGNYNYANPFMKEGEYKVECIVSINQQNGCENYIIDQNAKLVVNRVEWPRSKSLLTWADGSSMIRFESPIVNISPLAPDAPLEFKKPAFNRAVNIENHRAGTPIEGFSVKQFVWGGTEPYLFSKASGPDWINVSADGDISGTPDKVGQNIDLVIRVTDAAGATKKITYAVPETHIKNEDRTIVKNIVGQNFVTPVVGESFKRNYSEEIDFGENFMLVADFVSWRVKNGDTWEIPEGDVFEAGKVYRAEMCINIYNDYYWDYTFFPDYEVVDEYTQNVTINDLVWTFGYYDSDIDLYVESPEFVPHEHSIEHVPATAKTCITDGNIDYYKCSDCGELFEDAGASKKLSEEQVKIPAGHEYGEWIDEVPATSDREGTKAHKDCTECNKHFDENGNEIVDLVIPKLKGLSSGEVAGIIIGSVVVVGVGGFAVFWFVMKKKSFAQLLAAIKGMFKK